MFTGIVEELGEVVALESRVESIRLTLRGPTVTADAVAGASIAVDGVCLTVVAGHVDGLGTVVSRTPEGRWEVMRIGLAPALARYVVDKGSVAVDGVSLTVSAVGEGWFEASLIPTTLELTTLGRRRPGERVNLEVRARRRSSSRGGRGRAGGRRPRRGAPAAAVIPRWATAGERLRLAVLAA